MGGPSYTNGQQRPSKPTSRPAQPVVPSAASLLLPAIFSRLAGEDGLDVKAGLPALLVDLSRELPADQTVNAEVDESCLRSVAGDSTVLSLEQTLALVAMMQSSMQPSTSAVSLSGQGVSSSTLPGSPSRMPFKKALGKQRSYLETGTLAYDEAVVSYMAKLDEHRRKCETDGRYAEARAASTRLVELRTAQVAKLRSELLGSQSKEVADVNTMYEEETVKFTQIWDARIVEYEQNFARAVEELKALHEDARGKHEEELATKRPMRPKPSREYLNQKKVEESLAKNRQYMRAIKVKEAADEMYAADMQATQAAFEAEQRLRMAKFVAKQQAEFEALLQRGARGRDELELRRVAELERRAYRFRNVMSELENLHKLEVVQLENFLDGQVQAGKATPLKDASVFRRKRESIYSTTF